MGCALVFSRLAVPADLRGAETEEMDRFSGMLAPVDMPGFGGKITLLPGVPIEMTIYITAADSRMIKAPKVVLLAPKGIEANDFVPRKNLKDVTFADAEQGGIKWVVELKNADVRATLTCVVAFTLTPARDFAPGSFDLVWRLDDGGKVCCEKKVPCEVVLLPEKIDMPSRLKLLPYSLVHRLHSDDKLFSGKIRRLMKDCGTSEFYEGVEQKALIGELCGTNGMECVWAVMNDTPKGASSKCFPDLSTPENCTRDVGQKPHPQSKAICPMLKLARDNAYEDGFLDYCRRMLEDSGGKAFCWDFEPGRADSKCYCKRCVKAFFKFVKKPAETAFPGELVKKYPKEWLQFEIWRQGRVMGAWAASMREATPGCVLTACGHPVELTEKDMLRRYDLFCHSDARTYDDDVDLHMPMTYVKPWRVHGLMERTVAMLKKPVIPLVGLWYSDSPPASVLILPPAELELAALAAVSAGCKGVGFFPGYALYSDGLYLKSFLSISSKLAELEDYFLDGKADSSVHVAPKPQWVFESKAGAEKIETWMPDWKTLFKSRARRLEKNGQISWLLDLINFSEGDGCFVNISAPALERGRYVIYDPCEKQCLKPAGDRVWWEAEEIGRGVMFSVPAKRAVFLKIEKFRPELKWSGTIEEKDIRRQCEELIKAGGEAALNSGVRTVKTRDCVWIKTPAQTVAVNYRVGGRVWDWTVRAGGNALVNPPENMVYGGWGGLCFDLFAFPASAAWDGEEDMGYDVVAVGEKDHTVEVKLERRMVKTVLKGLRMSKTYRIAVNAPQIECAYVLRNDAGIPLELAFHSHHATVAAPGEEDGVRIWLPSSNGVMEKFVGHENVEFLPSTGSTEKKGGGVLSEGWVAFYNPADRRALVARFELDKIAKIQLLGNIQPPPLNWEYGRVTLLPGEVWETKMSFTCLEKATRESLPSIIGGKLRRFGEG